MKKKLFRERYKLVEIFTKENIEEMKPEAKVIKEDKPKRKKKVDE